MSPAEDDLDALLERLGGRTVYLATGTVCEIRPSAVVVSLDVAMDDLMEAATDPARLVVATPLSDERLAPGAHVLVEYRQDQRLLHGTVPAYIIKPVGYGSGAE